MTKKCPFCKHPIKFADIVKFINDNQNQRPRCNNCNREIIPKNFSAKYYAGFIFLLTIILVHALYSFFLTEPMRNSLGLFYIPIDIVAFLLMLYYAFPIKK